MQSCELRVKWAKHSQRTLGNWRGGATRRLVCAKKSTARCELSSPFCPRIARRAGLVLAADVHVVVVVVCIVSLTAAPCVIGVAEVATLRLSLRQLHAKALIQLRDAARRKDCAKTHCRAHKCLRRRLPCLWLLADCDLFLFVRLSVCLYYFADTIGVRVSRNEAFNNCVFNACEWSGCSVALAPPSSSPRILNQQQPTRQNNDNFHHRPGSRHRPPRKPAKHSGRNSIIYYPPFFR